MAVPAASPKVAVPSKSLTFNIAQLKFISQDLPSRQTSCRLMMDVLEQRASCRVQPNLVQPGNKELAKAHLTHLISGTAAFVGSSEFCGWCCHPTC